MMRDGTLSIVGHGVKGQGQICFPVRECHALHCTCRRLLQFSFTRYELIV